MSWARFWLHFIKFIDNVKTKLNNIHKYHINLYLLKYDSHNSLKIH